MEVAGLLTKEQLGGIFLNLDELMLVNAHFADKLKDAADIAAEQGDEVGELMGLFYQHVVSLTLKNGLNFQCGGGYI